MATVLLDTNVLVYFVSPASAQHGVCQTAVERMIEHGDKPAVSAQVLYEFWCAATRPAPANGLGWDTVAASHAIDGFRKEFDILHEPEVLVVWLELVVAHGLKGKRIHDAHLLATMKANRVTRLLTFNPADFPSEPSITILSPGP